MRIKNREALWKQFERIEFEVVDLKFVVQNDMSLTNVDIAKFNDCIQRVKNNIDVVQRNVLKSLTQED